MKFLSLLGQASDQYYGDPYMYDTNSMYGASSQMDSATAAGVLAFMLIFGLIAALVGYVISAFLLSRIFKKAGVEAWKAWVPIYNMWVLLELGDQKGFWAVIALIPIVNIISVVMLIIAEYNIGLKLQKEGWFVLLAIFLPIVWLIWLAFDKSTWKGLESAKPAASTNATPPPTTPTPAP
ncbi:MAG TPA: DUF5684 domain-containing protein [Candidatus Saccharimonadales bacterium]|nr:DUF5684 domain-containing protein [Candidatus Saccharimonadales bacterium]